MPKVTIGDEEPLKSALQRLRKLVSEAYRRQHYKTRIGCYEKPSDRKRRAERASRRRSRLTERFGTTGATAYLNLRSLHSRGEDPFRT